MLSFPVLICLLFTSTNCSFIQYGNQYPSWVYESSDYWVEYYSNNCSFINEYYHSQYPDLDLLNVSCIENDNPLQYNSSQLLELYDLDNVFSIILFNNNDTTKNMTKHKKTATYKVVYNMYIDVMINNSNLYADTPINDLPSDCYVSAIEVSGIDATYLTICELNHRTNKDKYSILWIRPWSWTSSTVDYNGKRINTVDYIFTCLEKGQYDISCSSMGTNARFSESGCSDIFRAIEIVENKIFACSGSFEGFLYDEAAQSLCNETQYHICESVEEVETLGLTRELCLNAAVTNNEFFATLTDQKRDYCTGLKGCSIDGSIMNNEGILNSVLRWGFHGWTFNIDVCNYSLTDSYSGGVLCCNGSAWNYTTPTLNPTISFEPSANPTTFLEGIGCLDGMTEREIISNQLYACPGVFGGERGIGSGGTGAYAEILCNDNYHICEDAMEAQIMGLTDEICTHGVVINGVEFFATNNLCGCSGAQSNITKATGCGELNSNLAEGASWHDWIWINDTSTYILNNSVSGGVLCCIDNIALTINFGYDTCTTSYEFSATQSRIFKNKKGVYVDIGSQLTTFESVTAISNLIETVPLLFDMKDIFSTFSFTITNIVAGIYIIIGIKWYEQDPGSTKPQNIEINMVAFFVAILQIMLIISFPMYTSFSSCLMDDLPFDLNDKVKIVGFAFGCLAIIFILMWLVQLRKLRLLKIVH